MSSVPVWRPHLGRSASVWEPFELIPPETHKVENRAVVPVYVTKPHIPLFNSVVWIIPVTRRCERTKKGVLLVAHVSRPLYYIVLCYIILYYIILYYIICYVMLCYVMLYYIMLCCVVLYCVILYYYIVLYYIILYYIILYYIILYYIILYYIIMLGLFLPHKFKSTAFLCPPLANVWCQVSWKSIRCYKICNWRPPPHTHTHTHTYTNTNDDVSLLPKIAVPVRDPPLHYLCFPVTLFPATLAELSARLLNFLQSE